MAGPRAIEIEALILGGGPGGTSAARAVASAGASVAIVERSSYDRFRVGETLPPEANVLLARLGSGVTLEGAGHLPSPGIVAAWGSDLPHENDFIFSPYGRGWHLDRREFDEALARSTVEAGARLVTGARALSCQRADRGGWDLELSTPDGTVSAWARWVLDATGRPAWFLRSLGIARRVYDRLVALVVMVDAPRRDDPRTFIESMHDGWWYVSALPGDRTIAAYFTDSDLHDLRPGGAATLWNDRLAASRLARERLAGIDRTGGLQVRACPTVQAARSAGEGWLAVGDAARGIDPLSSQGISWAIASGLDAAEVILADDPDCAAPLYETVWNRRFLDYLATRRAYYASERRWPDAPFWRRRSAEPEPLRKPAFDLASC